MKINDVEFRLLREYLHEACGIEVPSEKRYLFVTRLTGFLTELGCGGFSELYSRLSSGSEPELVGRLVEAMATNETSFFRERHCFEVLQREILVRIACRRLEAARYSRPRIRILSAGCSTGEEPYSIAIAVCEWLESQRAYTRGDVAVAAVDISKPVLDVAQRGIYDPARLARQVPVEYVRKYFRETPRGMSVREPARALVSFAEVNLARPFDSLGPFDVVFCRNVIIYLSAAVKGAVIDAVHRILEPAGVLVVGATESLYQLRHQFQTVHSGRTTYYVKD